MKEGAFHLISGHFLSAASLDLETLVALSFTIPLKSGSALFPTFSIPERVLKHDRALVFCSPGVGYNRISLPAELSVHAE